MVNGQMVLCFVANIVYLSSETNDLQTGNEYPVESHDYCLTTESFEPKCLKNEVIVMNSALYGRMKVGRCLKDQGLIPALRNDPQYFGCYVDVLSLMDSKCSAMNKCLVQGSDVGFQRGNPCYEELVKYLEASYECVAVIESERSCVVSASASPLHIMRPSPATQSCGTKSQPWIIEASTGQRINISLLDFSITNNDQDNLHSSNCQQFGYIIDKSNNRNTSICGMIRERRKLIYQSQSNLIEIVLNDVISRSEQQQQPKYMMAFQAVGCSDLVPPEDAWLRRSNNEAIVGCYTSRQTWQLHCREDLWIGVIGNCTREVSEIPLIGQEQNESMVTNIHEVLVITIILFLATIICVTVICCGFVCLRRHYAVSARKYINQLEEHSKYKILEKDVANQINCSSG